MGLEHSYQPLLKPQYDVGAVPKSKHVGLLYGGDESPTVSKKLYRSGQHHSPMKIKTLLIKVETGSVYSTQAYGDGSGGSAVWTYN